MFGACGALAFSVLVVSVARFQSQRPVKSRLVTITNLKSIYAALWVHEIDLALEFSSNYVKRLEQVVVKGSGFQERDFRRMITDSWGN